MSLSFKIVGLDKAVGEVRAAVFAGIDAGLNVAGARGQALVVENIRSAGAVAFGFLAGGIHFETVKTVDISRVEIKAGPPADVYADPVETGTGPHFPPPSALLPWVKQKLRVKDERQALSIAWAIAKTVAKRGTRAVHMFDKALSTLQGELRGIFERAIGEELQKRGAGS